MEDGIKRHPIRGFLYGIVFGLGLMFIVVGQGLAAFGTWPPFIVFLLGIIAGVVWSTYGPAKSPKGAPADEGRLPVSAVAATEPVTPAQPAASPGYAETVIDGGAVPTPPSPPAASGTFGNMVASEPPPAGPIPPERPDRPDGPDDDEPPTTF